MLQTLMKKNQRMFLSFMVPFFWFGLSIPIGFLYGGDIKTGLVVGFLCYLPTVPLYYIYYVKPVDKRMD